MSQPGNNNNLTDRLAYLERQIRFLKHLVGVLCLILASLTLMAQAPTWNRTLEAQRVVIKDNTGKVRAVLGMGAFGEDDKAVGLQLLAPDGTTRLQSFLRSDEAPFFQLRDRKGNVSAQLDVSASGFPGLLLFGPRSGPYSRSEVTFSFDFDDSPFAEFKDAKNKVIWRAPARSEGLSY